MELERKVHGYKGKYSKSGQSVEQREFTLKLLVKKNLLLAIEDGKSKVISIIPMDDIMGLIDDLNSKIKEAEDAARKLEETDKGSIEEA